MLVVGLLAIAGVTGCGEDAAAPTPAASTGRGKEASSSTDTRGPSLQLVDITAECGIVFTCATHVDSSLPMPAVMGGGVAVFDADGDGDLDILATEGSPATPVGTAADSTTARLFLQVAPLRFEDATERSGIDLRGYGQGLTVGDIDNDGDLDVLAMNYGPDVLLRNLGDGRFENATESSGIENDRWSVSGALFDLDRDGYLDLFLTRYVSYVPGTRCHDEAGRPEFCGPLASPPITDMLWRNRGNGTFEDISEAAGILGAKPAAGLGVVVQDFDHDGWVDVYVTNDAYRNHLWINRKDGTFSEEAVLQGAALNMNSQAEAGMGVVSEDFDGNGWQDLFMTHLVKESNTLYKNLGNGRGFRDATGSSGLAASSMRFTGFGTSAGDLDLDGDLDLLIANGAVNHHTERGGEPGLIEPWPLYAERNQTYLNDGTGRFTQDAENAFCGPEEVSRGLVNADLDGDGDLDVVVVGLDSPLRVYRNDTPRKLSWLRVRAVDPALGRIAIGARVEIADGDRTRIRTVTHAVGYGSAGPATPTFAISDAAKVVVVVWPTGEVEEFDIPGRDREVELLRGTGRSRP